MNYNEIESTIKEILRKHKKKAEDYEFIEEEDKPKMSDAYPVSGRIAVINTKEDKVQTYKIGHWTNWEMQLNQDIKNGLI